MENKILEVENLSLQYKGSDKNIIDSFSFHIFDGEILSLRGKSGAGKSTIIFAITHQFNLYDILIKSGSIKFLGQPILNCSEKEYRKIIKNQICLVPQASMNSFNPCFTIRTTLKEMFRFHSQNEKFTKAEIENRLKELMNLVHLDENVLNCYPNELSGGMKQRAYLALAIMFNPRLLILDEATTGLDILIQADVLGTVLELKKKNNMSILFISHDKKLSDSFADRSISL